MNSDFDTATVCPTVHFNEDMTLGRWDMQIKLPGFLNFFASITIITMKYPKSVMNDYTAYWDTVIREWAETGEIPASEAFWFSEQGHLGLHPKLMPEPYWGDIDSSSVVLVNMNPAGAGSESPSDISHRANRDNPSTLCGLMSGDYGAVARSFPLLGGLPFGYAGSDWWLRRVQWLDQLGIRSRRRPFAIELCAWHSPKWKGARYSHRKPLAIHRYIRDIFGPALRRALRGSDEHLVMCVGSEFARSVFPLVWPGMREITGEIVGSPYPVPGNARQFRVFHIPGEGHAICTSARGSNGIPSVDVFGTKEKEIYTKIHNTYPEV